MMTDIEASLSMSIDLSSIIETAVRVAVCSVLKEIQRFIGKDVTELRAALSRKECENEKLRAQLELARRQLRDRTGSEKRSILKGDPSSSSSLQDASGNNNSSHSDTDGEPSGLGLEHGSSIWSHPWNSDAGSDIQHNFIDPLQSTESKRDFTSDVHCSLDAAETDTEPNATSEPLDTIPDPVAVTTVSITSRGESTASNVNLVDAHTTRELRLVQPWDSDTGSDLQHNFIDPLGSVESKHGFSPDVDYRLEAAESEPNPTREPLDMIPDPEQMKTDPSLSYEESKASALDEAHTTRELRVVQVKEELPTGLPSSTVPELSHPAKPKPYICGECGKSYLWLKSLKKHQKIHSGEAPFSCSICCKHFSSQQLFEGHQRVHTSLRPHRCASCPKTFSHLSNLKKHQLIHTGEKPHHCGLCGKRFRQIQHLKEHHKTHEDSKPFRCGECGWGFNHGSNFKRHLLVHTRQKMRHGLGS
ncbi:hypothetical protein COCON_G00005220 [Conger conger]|uniref:C2H2-type domain-containing protein n=1 Tax=Conger conger TaxID=82655 RepID=A0A9Q1I8M3_CONCO|nr:hypothetical protein COCON_G00005220 [Conger conger]